MLRCRMWNPLLRQLVQRALLPKHLSLVSRRSLPERFTTCAARAARSDRSEATMQAHFRSPSRLLDYRWMVLLALERQAQSRAPDNMGSSMRALVSWSPLSMRAGFLDSNRIARHDPTWVWQTLAQLAGPSRSSTMFTMEPQDSRRLPPIHLCLGLVVGLKSMESSPMQG